MTINQLINNESRWTQGANARDKDGVPVNIATVDYFRPPKIKDISSFSLHGAVVMLYPPEKHQERRNKIMFGLRKAVQQHTGKDMPVAKFNDASTTTFEDIQKVLTIFKNNERR